MNRKRLISTIAVLAAVATTTQGCAAVLLGYVVADQINKSDAAKACRQNLQTINAARMSHGQEPFPDQCH